MLNFRDSHADARRTRGAKTLPTDTNRRLVLDFCSKGRNGPPGRPRRVRGKAPDRPGGPPLPGGTLGMILGMMCPLRFPCASVRSL